MGSPTITFDGRIGTDIEYRAVGNSGVARFRLITNDRKKVEEEWTDANTTGWNVEIWGTAALNVKNHLEKGDPIIGYGVIFEDRWNDKATGEPKSSMLIKAEKIGLDLGKVKTQ